MYSHEHVIVTGRRHVISKISATPTLLRVRVRRPERVEPRSRRNRTGRHSRIRTKRIKRRRNSRRSKQHAPAPHSAADTYNCFNFSNRTGIRLLFGFIPPTRGNLGSPPRGSRSELPTPTPPPYAGPTGKWSGKGGGGV